MNFNEGSFRDPSGYVFEENNNIYRTVNNNTIDRYSKMKDSGLIDKLVKEKWLIPTWEVDKNSFSLSNDVAFILQHKKLKVITYPYEWTPEQLKTAALFHLKFQLRLLDLNWTLSDATAYNIQFDIETGEPIFIDTLSLIPYNDGDYWKAQNQFCEQFLNPLLLSGFIGFDFNPFYRGNIKGIPVNVIEPMLGIRKYFSLTLLLNITIPAKIQRNQIKKTNQNKNTKSKIKNPLPKSAYISILKGLKKFIEKIDLDNLDNSIWSDYSVNNTYSKENIKSKEEFVYNFCKEVRPEVLWDIGCNSGHYSQVAICAGAKYIIGLDSDITALNRAYINMAKNKNPFIPIYFDAANPSPNQGWLLKERKSIFERSYPDAIIALAVIHHLVIGNNIPIESCITFFLSIADKGVIEFVGKKDVTVIEMLQFREDIFKDYNYIYFKSLLEKETTIIKEEFLLNSDRVLVYYEKRK